MKLQPVSGQLGYPPQAPDFRATSRARIRVCMRGRTRARVKLFILLYIIILFFSSLRSEKELRLLLALEFSNIPSSRHTSEFTST